jgi:hypothetical protein
MFGPAVPAKNSLSNFANRNAAFTMQQVQAKSEAAGKIRAQHCGAWSI